MISNNIEYKLLLWPVLKKTFKYFDKSGKGVITRMDLRNILRHLGMNPTEDEIEDMINNYDENG